MANRQSVKDLAMNAGAKGWMDNFGNAASSEDSSNREKTHAYIEYRNIEGNLNTMFHWPQQTCASAGYHTSNVDTLGRQPNIMCPPVFAETLKLERTLQKASVAAREQSDDEGEDDDQDGGCPCDAAAPVPAAGLASGAKAMRVMDVGRSSTSVKSAYARSGHAKHGGMPVTRGEPAGCKSIEDGLYGPGVKCSGRK